MKTVCFTGVRPNKLCGYNKEAYADFVASLTDSLEDFYSKGVRTYISGGAQGFDQLAAWAVENLQNRHSDVKNVIYVPFKGQERLWKENGIFGQAQYRGILRRADEVKYLADELTDTKEIASAMHVRNHAMVDKADAVIALFPYKEIGDTKGGTVATMKYALSKDKSIYRVDYEVSDKVVMKGVEKFTNQQDVSFDEVHDDIFKCPSGDKEALCVTTNGVVKKDGSAVMGKGMALLVDQKYNVGSKLGKHLKENGNVPCDLGIVADGFHVISFPTKNDWSESSDLNLIKQSAEKVKEMADSLGLEKIYITRPGCGLGNLEWSDVKRTLSTVFDDRFCIVDNTKDTENMPSLAELNKQVASDSKKVFVSGSIAVKEIPDSVKEVLESHIENGDTFLVGDASGVDSLIQRYLNDKEYSNVIVYHSGSKIRNKINPDWQDRAIYVPKGVSGRDFYTAKDEAMTKDCDEGIAIWDGKSVGTKANIDRLSKQGKSCFTYNQKTLERTENQDDDYIDSSKYFEFSD